MRPHLEYALPAWFFMAGGHINELERVQAQCLKKIMGLHAHSSSEALQVTSGVLPFCLRAEELCAREHMRILEKQLDHPLREIMPSQFQAFNDSPLSFLRHQSKAVIK